MGPQVVAEGEVLAFLLAAGDAQVHVVRAGPPSRLGEVRIDVIELADGDEPVSRAFQRLDVRREVVERTDRDLDVDDRLGGKPRD